MKISRLSVFDIRFPTSQSLDGSDAMNAAPDYSAAYVILHTDSDAGIEGHGLTFTIGRGNDICVAEGWRYFKQKVGGNIDDDIRRATILREEIGWDRKLMMDANQVWDVDESISNMRRLAAFDPWWIEEPTSPDDVLGHAAIRRRIAPIRVATGEHCHNRVMFKQLLQAGAIDFCQVDAARLGGLNEVLVVVLMAAKFGVPVCPHAGGVGLCEYVQNISLFDYIAVSASLENRVLEYVDHLHEHFVDPVVIRNGRYMPPMRPGYSVEMHGKTLKKFQFQSGGSKE